jgi:general secretion pathway protein G
MSCKHNRPGTRVRRGGFTLMEVLLVLAILVILASVSILGVTQYMTQANNQTAKLKLKALQTAIDAYYVGESQHPQSLPELRQPAPRTGAIYVSTDDALVDPWRREIQYQPPQQMGLYAEYRLWSLGADGQDGSPDDISTMTNQ